MTEEKSSEFEREASSSRVGLIAEFWDFLKDNKKWWLLPIITADAGSECINNLGEHRSSTVYLHPVLIFNEIQIQLFFQYHGEELSTGFRT